MNTADQILKLQDEARELQAQALGKRLEIAMLKGQRKAAEQYMRQMNGITALRKVARHAQEEGKAPCYFVTAGEADGARI
jgi:hypothetical protein